MDDMNLNVMKADISMSNLFAHVVTNVGVMDFAGDNDGKFIEEGMKSLFALPEPVPGIVVRTKLSDK